MNKAIGAGIVHVAVENPKDTPKDILVREGKRIRKIDFPSFERFQTGVAIALHWYFVFSSNWQPRTIRWLIHVYTYCRPLEGMWGSARAEAVIDRLEDNSCRRGPGIRNRETTLDVDSTPTIWGHNNWLEVLNNKASALSPEARLEMTDTLPEREAPTSGTSSARWLRRGSCCSSA